MRTAGVLPRLLLALLLLLPAFAAGSRDGTAAAAAAAPTPPLLAPRGGDAADGVDGTTERAVLAFLDSFGGSDADADHPFHVQGLRWHLLSLVRDAKRLERLAARLSETAGDAGGDDRGDDDDEEGLERLEAAADYVVNFNMAGFFRVQSGLFDGFLREHLCDEGAIGDYVAGGRDAAAKVAGAFEEVVSRMGECRARAEGIGKELYERAKAASDPSNPTRDQRRLLDDVTRLSEQLVDRLSPLRDLQERLVVPAVARAVSPRAQKSFNNRVLRNLGLLESRLHLVGMRDAVWESGVAEERAKFDAEIPYVARAMIERWRRGLYEPRAGALDDGLEGCA